MHFFITSKKIKITTILLVAFCVLISFSFTEKKSPIENTRTFSLQKIKVFQQQLDSLQNILQSNFSQKKIAATI